MRLCVVAILLSVLAVPAMAGPVAYTFDITSGMVSRGGASSPLGGTFSVLVYQAGTTIAPGDRFLVNDCNVYNLSTLAETSRDPIIGWAVSFPAGGLRYDDIETTDAGGTIGTDWSGAVNIAVHFDWTFYYLGTRYHYQDWYYAPIRPLAVQFTLGSSSLGAHLDYNDPWTTAVMTGVAPLPEPASLCVLALGGLPLVWRRR